MPVILTRVSSWRWPWRFLYPVLFLNFWMTIFGPRRSSEDLGGHGHLGERRGVVGDRVAVDEQHGASSMLPSLSALMRSSVDDGADLDLLLPATGAHNCVNHFYVPFLRGTAPLGSSSRGPGPTLFVRDVTGEPGPVRTMRRPRLSENHGARGQHPTHTNGQLYPTPLFPSIRAPSPAGVPCQPGTIGGTGS